MGSLLRSLHHLTDIHDSQDNLKSLQDRMLDELIRSMRAHEADVVRR